MCVPLHEPYLSPLHLMHRAMTVRYVSLCCAGVCPAEADEGRRLRMQDAQRVGARVDAAQTSDVQITADAGHADEVATGREPFAARAAQTLPALVHPLRRRLKGGSGARGGAASEDGSSMGVMTFTDCECRIANPSPTLGFTSCYARAKLAFTLR